SQQQIGQGKYTAICDHKGILINDPIAQKLSETCYWLSIADSDIWYWARCVAGERALDVNIDEPDASPLAIQGPKAEDVVAQLFGDWVRDLKYFWFRDADLDGIPLKVARSGWSKQGGFELYLLDHSKGDALWNVVKEAGKPFDIGPGYPNPSERTESGLINWDVDADPETNPFELRMCKFVDLDLGDHVIGMAALRKIAERGPARHQLGILLEGDEEDEDQSIRLVIEKDGRAVGHMTHKAWSYRLKRMIGYALVSVDVCEGENVEVIEANQRRTGKLVSLPFSI
ncbi:MAG: glycine cleavage T C-terminal barrel domain-containing protein, partial [Pseudomonadota bacterium]